VPAGAGVRFPTLFCEKPNGFERQFTRGLVEERRHAKALPNLSSSPMRQSGAGFERNARDRHEGKHIQNAHARMHPFVLTDAKQFKRFLRQLKRCFEHKFRRPRECKHAAVMVSIGRAIEQLNSLYRVSQRIQNTDVAAFRDIGNTLDTL